MSGLSLSLALLGPPVIEVDGRPLQVDTRKATALLAYLAVEDRPVRRDTLAALLWPENDPERARSALRRTLSTLRTALGGRWLETGRDLISLGGPGIGLDVDELRALASDAAGLEPLRRAAALARGPFLEGFGLRDSAAFDDWQQLTTESLSREVAAVLDRLVDAAAAAGDHAGAIAAARRRLGLDPLQETAHRRLIEAYAAAGDRSAALEQYRQCVRALDRELGVRPLDETTALYHSVLEGTYAPRAAVLQVPELPAERARPGGFVGRERELRALREAYDGVGPDGRLALIVGETGLGKSRLAHELLADVERGGATTVSMRCFQDEAELAYGVLTGLLREAVARRGLPAGGWWVEEAARLLPELGQPPARGVDSTAAELRFYEAVSELLLRTLDGDRPGVAFVDDAQWADEASLRLLLFLARRLAGRPLLLLLGCVPDPAADHPAAAFLELARRDAGMCLVRPAPLAAADVLELVEAAGHDGELAARLHRESRGLPFFVVGYLEALGRQDDAGAEWAIPPGVRELLAGRLASLGELGAQVVAAAAVLGGSFDVDALREASGRSEDETVSAVDELVARGVLVETAEGTLEFRHEAERSLAYEGLTLARRRLLHRRAAAALGARDGRDERAALIAHHLAAAGDDGAAAELYGVAGDRARALYANAEALGHYRAALALGGSDPATLHEAIGDLETLAGDYGAAFASYQAAAALAPAALAPEIEHRLGLLHLRRGDWELAEASLAAALERLEGAAAARGTADRALVAHRRGLPGEAARLAAEALALAEGAADAPARAQAHNILGVLAASRGDAAEATRNLEQALALADEAGDDAAAAAALNNLSLAVAADGDLDRALGLTREGLARVAAVGDRHREAALRNRHADLLHAAGRDDEAMAELKSAVALFAEIGEEGKLEPEIWKLSEW